MSMELKKTSFGFVVWCDKRSEQISKGVTRQECLTKAIIKIDEEQIVLEENRKKLVKMLNEVYESLEDE